MTKNFDLWNQTKKQLESKINSLTFHEREIWWCSLGINLGDEQDGKNFWFERPVLIIKKFNSNLAWALPLSTKHKVNNKYYFNLDQSKFNSSIILSQLRIVSIKRFRRYLGKIGRGKFQEIIEQVKILI